MRQTESVLSKDGDSLAPPPELAVLEPKRIQDLVSAIDSKERLDLDVEQLLSQLANEFVYNVAHHACQLALHRGSDTLDVSDVVFHLGFFDLFLIFSEVLIEKNWDIKVPGFSSGEAALTRSQKRQPSTAHQARIEQKRYVIRPPSENNKKAKR
jgi:transcription initiation factor TFIID subunit 12